MIGEGVVFNPSCILVKPVICHSSYNMQLMERAISDFMDEKTEVWRDHRCNSLFLFLDRASGDKSQVGELLCPGGPFDGLCSAFYLMPLILTLSWGFPLSLGNQA